MNKHKLLSTVVFLLAAHKGDEGNGGGNTNKGTLEEQVSSLNATVTERDATISTLTKERDDARNETATLKGQFESLSKEATDSKAKVTELEGKLTKATADHTEVSGKLTKAEESVSRLTALCGVKGIDPNASVPETKEPGNSGSAYDRWMNATGSAKHAIFQEHKKEIRAEAAKREAASR